MIDIMAAHNQPTSDFTEKANSCCTFLLLLALALITLILPAVVPPAICHTPTHFVSPQIDFANIQCAYAGQYFDESRSISNQPTEKLDSQATAIITWAPCMLATMAFAVQFPYLIFGQLQTWFGINVEAIVHEIQRHQEQRTEEDRLILLKRTIQVLAVSFESGENSTYFLLTFARKFLSTVISLSLFLAVQIATDPFSYLQGSGRSGSLRSQSICNYITHGNNHVISFNCIYPVNLMLQKQFIFLAFYCIFLFLLNFSDLIMCATMLFIPEMRDRKLATFIALKDKDAASKVHRTLDRNFASFLGFDGFFLLKIINQRLGELAWGELCILLWQKYQDTLEINIYNDTEEVKVSGNPCDPKSDTLDESTQKQEVPTTVTTNNQKFPTKEEVSS